METSNSQVSCGIICSTVLRVWHVSCLRVDILLTRRLSLSATHARTHLSVSPCCEPILRPLCRKLHKHTWPVIPGVTHHRHHRSPIRPPTGPPPFTPPASPFHDVPSTHIQSLFYTQVSPLSFLLHSTHTHTTF